jgi:hypothetical protein
VGLILRSTHLWQPYAALIPRHSARLPREGSPTWAVCAVGEVLLTTLVEAHGEVPNAASEKLAEASIMIMRARIACDEGRVKEAVAVYDRLIAELGSVVTHRGQ